MACKLSVVGVKKWYKDASNVVRHVGLAVGVTVREGMVLSVLGEDLCQSAHIIINFPVSLNKSFVTDLYASP